MAEPERHEYLLRRAAQERVATKLAADSRAARAHQELAEEFSRMAEEVEQNRPAPTVLASKNHLF